MGGGDGEACECVSAGVCGFVVVFSCANDVVVMDIIRDMVSILLFFICIFLQ